VSKRSIGPVLQAGPSPVAPDEYASCVSLRVPEYPASLPLGPDQRCAQSSTPLPVALSSFAADGKSGSLAGTTVASVFLARAPAVVDVKSAKPACEYASEYRQSSPADMLRPKVLRMAEASASRHLVMRSPVMRTKSPVASASAPGSPRDVLANFAVGCRQAASKRLCRVLRSRFAAPEA
jgi:hypothetical protein